LINALPFNSFVNTVQNATVEEAVFSVSAVTPAVGGGHVTFVDVCQFLCYTWSDKVRELTAVKVLHASLLNITEVPFKVLSL
jgi:hypothetical protein